MAHADDRRRSDGCRAEPSHDMEKTTRMILVIHGAGMSTRGKVQTEVVGTLALPEYDVKIRAYAAALGYR